MTEYNLEEIRKLVRELRQTELQNLVFDKFTELYRDEIPDLDALVRELVSYAYKHRQIEALLHAVNETNATLYQEYELRLRQSSASPSAAAPQASGDRLARRSAEAAVPESTSATTPDSVQISYQESSARVAQPAAFALVIGISNYEDNRHGGQAQKFWNLKWAAKDAEDFADFLKNYPLIRYEVLPLLDKDATLPAIKQGLEEIRRGCERSRSQPSATDPLVLVYFSGHGMTDDAGRQYLIPYGARKDQLFATALWNKEFSNCLEELNTKRLVVLLDACHSGRPELESPKGSPQYNPEKDLASNRGRYVIASCGPLQESYELDNNGIFTSQLLALLRGDTDDFDNEEIELYNLYPVLRDRVSKIAWENFGAKQEPAAKIAGPTDIVLAISERGRRRKLEYLEAVCAQMDETWTDLERPAAVKGILRDYVSEGSTLLAYKELYGIFDQFFKTVDAAAITECCRILKGAYKRSIATGERKLFSAKAVNKFV